MVSDLGLATFSGKDGAARLVRSIATAEPVAGARCPPHRAQQRGAGHGHDAMPTGAAAFDAGLLNGEGGDAPALARRASAEGDYSFVDLTQPAFDLTDRGVEGRAAPGAVDAFVYTERGVYRRGETVHATVLLRDASANAMTGTPLTLVVERPDGVEYLAHHAERQGRGRPQRSTSPSIPAPRAAPGASRR